MAHEITYNNFEMSLVVFMPINITKNHAFTYTNVIAHLLPYNIVTKKRKVKNKTYKARLAKYTILS